MSIPDYKQLRLESHSYDWHQPGRTPLQIEIDKDLMESGHLKAIIKVCISCRQYAETVVLRMMVHGADWEQIDRDYIPRFVPETWRPKAGEASLFYQWLPEVVSVARAVTPGHRPPEVLELEIDWGETPIDEWADKMLSIENWAKAAGESRKTTSKKFHNGAIKARQIRHGQWQVAKSELHRFPNL